MKKTIRKTIALVLGLALAASLAACALPEGLSPGEAPASQTGGAVPAGEESSASRDKAGKEISAGQARGEDPASPAESKAQSEAPASSAGNEAQSGEPSSPAGNGAQSEASATPAGDETRSGTPAASSADKAQGSAGDFSQDYRDSVYYDRLMAAELTGDGRADIMAVARSQLGYREGDAPGQLDGSRAGTGDYTEYGRYYGSGGTGWCSEFISWCARQAGIPASVVGDSLSARASSFGGDYHPWEETVYAGGSFQPRPGDIVLFSWGEKDADPVKDHSAFFAGEKESGGSLYLLTLDGNSGDRVKEGTTRILDRAAGRMAKGYIEGIVAPRYSGGDGMTASGGEAQETQKPQEPQESQETQKPQEGQGSQPAQGSQAEKADTAAYAREVAELVNRERSLAGLAPLDYSEEIARAAQVRARELAELFSHTRPDGSRCFTVLKGIGYLSAGENIAEGYEDPADVMGGWMNSETHRNNILKEGFQAMGVGCYEEDGTLYWVQLFARLTREDAAPEEAEEKPGEQPGESPEKEPEEAPAPEEAPGEEPEAGGDPNDVFDLRNYEAVPAMSPGEAETAGHCLMFLSTEDGQLYWYSCHEGAANAGFTPEGAVKTKLVHSCETCTGELGSPVRYCATPGQVHEWAAG